MSDATDWFFDDLARRGHEPALGHVTGRVRFDIVHAEREGHWLVVIERGDITVSRRKGKSACDCSVRSDAELFERLARGEDNAMAATLRGALVCAGEVDLLLAVQRLFPGRAG
jgi:predicted lipid carrier protein YhbT